MDKPCRVRCEWWNSIKQECDLPLKEYEDCEAIVMNEHKLKNMKNKLLAESFKKVLFRLWKRVEDGHEDSRSFIGDLALEIQSTIYDDENKFFKEYRKWKEREEE